MAKKRDVGMAGSSGYDSEFYKQDYRGNVVKNERTMKLQGMDPKKRIADSQANEIGDNSFNSFKSSAPLTKAMMNDYKKKNK